MSLHQSKRISVPNEERRGKREKTVAAFYRGQDTRIEEPDHFLILTDAVRLRDEGLGRFVNRGSGFLRYDTSQPVAITKPDLNFHGGNASRSIDEDTMNDFVAEQRYAIAAVKCWASKSRLNA